MTTKLSVLIPTFNEEENIKKCIESVKWADEVFVVDSYSTDRTLIIAKELADKVVCHEFKDFASQKNWAMKKLANDWVLWLDADETAQPGLEEEVRSFLEHNSDEDVCVLRRKNYFLGRPVNHGSWGKDEVIRVFNRKHCCFEGIVHEKLTYRGEKIRLKKGINHTTFRSFDHYISKLHLYAIMGSKKLHEKGKKAGFFSLILRPLHHFLKSYLLKLGILDGISGLLIALMGAYYVFLKYSMLWEIEQTNKERKINNL